MKGCAATPLQVTTESCWLSICGVCDGAGLGTGFGVGQGYMNSDCVREHVGEKSFRELTLLMYKRVESRSARDCKLNGAMFVAPDEVFISRPVDMKNGVLAPLAKLISDNRQLRPVAVTLIQSLKEMFRESSQITVQVSLQDLARALCPSPDDETNNVTNFYRGRRWDGSESFGHSKILNYQPRGDEALLYRSYAVSLALLAVYSHAPNCEDGLIFKQIVCNHIAKLQIMMAKMATTQTLNDPLDDPLDELETELSSISPARRWLGCFSRRLEASRISRLSVRYAPLSATYFLK